jgi:hypothetical protein
MKERNLRQVFLIENCLHVFPILSKKTKNPFMEKNAVAFLSHIIVHGMI